ncbi:glycosyltransferase family 4 protein [Natronobiforma cellulositropha]|uniref:glycosyltransferase family 4 protein n=1 Tax=Natronobiforma cellulositropha TaxID=1679076 RepID=UPI0021D574D2|nr:glycosyltransferase family 4 protein [Natronobiforma cellulositropha]
MNVLLLSGQLGSGGAPRVCYQVARHLPDDVDLQVAYLGGRDGLVEKFEAESIPVERLAEDMLSVSAARAFDKHLRENDYDVVHTHMISAALIGRPIARLHRIPVVHTVHTNYKMRPLTAKLPDVLTAPFANRAVCVSDSVARSLPWYYFADTEVIYNCIDVEAVREAGAIPWDDLEWTADLDPDAPVVANVARFDPKKRRIDLVEGFEHTLNNIPDAQLVLTGRTGKRQQRLENRAIELGIADNVHFVGFVDNPQSVYYHADVIALPSKAEGFSISMLEAMAHQVPIVASNIPAFVDALGEDYPAFVPVESPRALGRELSQALSDQSYSENMTSIINERIERFSGKNAAQAYARTFRSVIT